MKKDFKLNQAVKILNRLRFKVSGPGVPVYMILHGNVPSTLEAPTMYGHIVALSRENGVAMVEFPSKRARTGNTMCLGYSLNDLGPIETESFSTEEQIIDDYEL